MGSRVVDGAQELLMAAAGRRWSITVPSGVSKAAKSVVVPLRL